MGKFGDLITYTRQSVLRYGEYAEQKMKNVGVCYSKEQIAAIMLSLQELSIPKDICLKNRYWDPFVLDAIYKNYSESVPNHPKEYGATAKLDRMLKFLRDTPETSEMYKKYIPEKFQKGAARSLLKTLCIQWAKETTLSEILSKMKYSDEKIEDEIEETIELLQNTVSYRIPLLLKPIFDIKNSNSVFLACMQSGAYSKISRIMIEMGVPRECALYLNEVLFSNFDTNEKNDEQLEEKIRTTLLEYKKTLPYWISVQLNFLG